MRVQTRRRLRKTLFFNITFLVAVLSPAARVPRLFLSSSSSKHTQLTRKSNIFQSWYNLYGRERPHWLLLGYQLHIYIHICICTLCGIESRVTKDMSSLPEKLFSECEYFDVRANVRVTVIRPMKSTDRRKITQWQERAGRKINFSHRARFNAAQCTWYTRVSEKNAALSTFLGFHVNHKLYTYKTIRIGEHNYDCEILLKFSLR